MMVINVCVQKHAVVLLTTVHHKLYKAALILHSLLYNTINIAITILHNKLIVTNLIRICLLVLLYRDVQPFCS